MYRVIASRAFVAPATARARIAGASLRAPSRDTRLSQLFLAATALSLLTPSRGMAASANGQCANPQGDVPSNIQAIATDILRMYTTKSAEEQGSIVHKHYRPDARFVDPLMDVGTPREIHLAFYSLIKMFTSVDVEQKSLSWNAEPLLPGNIKAEDVQQVVLNNKQVYHLSKRTIELDVNTYITIEPKSGQIVRHQDRWTNSNFAVPGLLKKPTGLFTSGLLKLLGWGKHIDEAAPK